MSNQLLIAHKFKKIGLFLFFPSLLLGLYFMITNSEINYLNIKMISLFNRPILPGKVCLLQIQEVNLTNTLFGVLFLSSCLLIGFSKEKIEDEYIANIRLSSLLWAVLLNNLLLLFALILFYDFTFFQVMVYNMFTTMVLFILRFNFMLYKNQRIPINEK